jgi:hypothetical protein
MTCQWRDAALVRTMAGPIARALAQVSAAGHAAEALLQFLREPAADRQPSS